MSALAMMQRSERVAHRHQDYQRMSIYRLRELARASHPEHTDEAASAFVARALDMEVQRRTEHKTHLGYHTHSPGAPGLGSGGTDIAREPLVHICDSWEGTHDAHEYVASWLRLARLSDRQLMAALIQARKLHGNGDQDGAGKLWVKSYDQIAADLAPYARALGWAPGTVVVVEMRIVERQVVREIKGKHETSIKPRKREETVAIIKPLFVSGKAIIDAARRARASLIFLAKV